MKKFAAAIAALPFTWGIAFAQGAGNAAQGQAYWASPQHACKNCHGDQAEGAFGPDLAGRGLNTAQVFRAVRQPWGIMPAFIDSQLNEQQAADLAAYFAGLPKPAEPGKWKFEPAASMPAGQAMLLNVGCGQCHSPNFQGPRGNLGAVNADFEYFANLVYNHTTATPQHRAALGGNAGGNLDMGNYSRTRLSEGDLRQIYAWAHDQIGFRPPLQARLSAGAPAANGVTYTLNVANGGLPGKGLTAEGVRIQLEVPAGTNVVAATGPGYQGVKANTAEWMVPSLAPKETQAYTITLSKAAEPGQLKGSIHWAKPTPSPADVINIGGGPAG